MLLLTMIPATSFAQMGQQHCAERCYIRWGEERWLCEQSAELTTSQLQATNSGTTFVLLFGWALITSRRDDCLAKAEQAANRCYAGCGLEIFDFWNEFDDWGFLSVWGMFDEWRDSIPNDSEP